MSTKHPIPVGSHERQGGGPPVGGSPGSPVADDIGFKVESAGKGGNAASLLDRLIENIHGGQNTTIVGALPQENCHSPAMDTLAERLKLARTMRGDLWTQAHLAAAAGVSTGTIGNIESGLRGVKKPIGTLPAIAKALAVSYDWLATGEGEMLDGAVAVPAGLARTARAEPPSDDTERRLTRLLAVVFQIPESQRAAALVAATEVLLDHLPPPPSV